MRLAKYLSMLALLLAPFAAQLHAQVNVAGSSALWIETGQGAYTQGNTTTTCAWTNTTSGVTFTLEQRPVGGAPFNQENGNTWVVWTPGGSGCGTQATGTPVYAYINLDSTLGNRCLFAQPSCTLNTTATTSTAGANALPGITDSLMPSSVISAFNGQPIVIAGTDILPVDAKFATFQGLALCGPLSSGTQFLGYGYGPGPVGQTVNSFYSTKNFHVIDFNVFGTDPITGTSIPAYTITPVGAAPVVVFVNNTNASGFGNAAITNVNRGTLGLLFSGILVRTADVLPQAFAGLSASYSAVTALSREFLSGTYNTFDHGVPNNKELFRAQDIGNCTTGTDTVTSNPLNLTRTISDGGTSTTGTHNRVIGTGEMIKEGALVTDSIGYAFWSAGNFAPSTAYTVGNLKYVTVDGVDPILDSYAGGTIPNSGNGLLPNVTLAHVADGSYPIWSEQRFVSFAAGAGPAATLASWAQTQVSFGAGATQPDWITAPKLTVFHAHFAPSFINFNATNTASDGPRVCGAGSNPEDGGDVGGLVFSQQAGGDYCVLKGNYGVAGGVGPTNTASFGTRQ